MTFRPFIVLLFLYVPDRMDSAAQAWHGGTAGVGSDVEKATDILQNPKRYIPKPPPPPHPPRSTSSYS